MACPAHLGDGGFGLRAGGVEHQHIHRAEPAGDRGDQLGDLLLIGDIGAEGLGHAAVAADGAADLLCLPVAAAAIDRHGETVLGQTACDLRAQAARAARHQSDPPIGHRHAAIIALRRAHQADHSAVRINPPGPPDQRSLRPGIGQVRAWSETKADHAV